MGASGQKSTLVSPGSVAHARTSQDSRMITITDIAFVRYAAPDLDVMEQFLIDAAVWTEHLSARR